MRPPLRRAVACLSVVTFLPLYVWAAIGVAEWLPEHPVIDLIYFAVAGTLWGFPLIPLIRWANQGRS